jgi:ureidoacrylate peracid hydrolase
MDPSRSAPRADIVERLAPERSALLVIDVQNDYCDPEGALGRHGTDLGAVAPALANIHRLIAASRACGATVIFIRNWHQVWTDSPAWRARTPRQSGAARAGSWGAEFYSVAPLPGEPVIEKQRYDAFIGTPLDSALRALGRSTVVMTGFGTNVCVESTARHAVFLDYRIVFASDATGTGDGENAHAATLATIARHFGPVASTAEIVEAWRTHAGRNDPDRTS